ncbi:MAG: glycoside hydrolase family 13 protein [Ruminococcaceae bacterium]|nr:glycoside hydrolase family 13 protein [Oscillospiraceae bacterium]
MRILFDSKLSAFKEPFGTLIPGQTCTLHIHIPETVPTVKVECILCHPDGSLALSVPMEKVSKKGAYEIFRGEFSFRDTGLYFYHFYITTRGGGFRLFKYGNDTNMEDGALWQISCIPGDFHTPDWSKGATIYQVFPDRFCKVGDCDLTGKLEPYTVHENWDDEVDWRPNAKGEILNNDFFGGNFRGITEKMDYIASLGTTILYLNPISKSFSSHRYDTGDYKQPDPILGTMEDFRALCDAAHKRGIKVILDGVYSHTGSDSLYFDKNRTFGGNGAYCTKNSPYYSWYQFKDWPDRYNSWWGFDTLPTVNKMDPAFVEYIITGRDSVVEHWLNAGCDGFRLDVADELPNEFLVLLKKRIRQIRPDALLMGEVWEDASNKESYSQLRRYFVDGELDSVMNYPFRTAILKLLRGQDDGRGLENTVMTIAENYPREVLLSNMNLLSTHDSPRILTALVDDFEGSREEKAARRLPPEQMETALQRLYPAAFLQYTLPGSPSIYYGDEAGMEGHNDPFNRRTYPWGRENRELTDWFRKLGALRNAQDALRLGDIRFFHARDGKIGFTREYAGKALRCYVNLSEENWEISGGKVLFGHELRPLAPDWIALAPMGVCITEAE